MTGTRAKSVSPATGKDAKKRVDELAKAEATGEGAIPTVMEQAAERPATAELPEEEKQLLQSIAHGGEGHGHSYGSGPGFTEEGHADEERRVGNERHAENEQHAGDERKADSKRQEGDSASPAASALATRTSSRARRHGQ